MFAARSEQNEEQRRQQRRGSVVVLMALLMAILVAMAAFAIDIGYIHRVQGELQNAADAAALASAQQTLRPIIRNNSSNHFLAEETIAGANSTAKEYAGYHQAGGVELELLDSDIVVGYSATPGPQAVTAWTNGQPAPNCIQVTTRRDTTANGSLPLFLGPVLGTSITNLRATATAAYDDGRYDVTGFKTGPAGETPKLLPIAFSLTFWNDFVQSGLSPDGLRYDDHTVTLVLPNSPVQAPSNVTSGADNIPEIRGAYPDTTSPGNFGLVNLKIPGDSNEPTFANWITNGPTAADIGSFGANGLQATSAAPQPVDAGPGWKSSLIKSLEDVIGQSRAVPLYSSFTGSGSGGSYNIVGFGGVTIVKAEASGSNMIIVFQPAIVIDPTATLGNGSDGNGNFVYPKLPLSLVR